MNTPLAQTLLEKIQADNRKGMADRESSTAEVRNKLRDMVVHLRDAGQPHTLTPASTTTPSFKIGDVQNFPYVSSPLRTSPGNGHLSEGASKDFFSHMKDASTKTDAASRDAATGRAAKAVANDYAHQHGLLRNPQDTAKAHILHEARAQATFIAREIGQKLGVGPVTSSVVGYSLERALEKEGFKVLASHAIDKSVDVFKATASAAANATGMRNSAESSLNKSMQWLAAHGVTPTALKQVVANHTGKLTALVAISQNPEVVQRAAHVLQHSDRGLAVITGLAKDEQLRKAVGTMTLGVGETLGHVHKGAGSAAILAGSALRGDSMEDTGRHMFRAALSIAGGAAGGIAAGTVSAGFGAIAGGIAGSAAGSALADKLIAVYDNHYQNNRGAVPEPSRVTQQELDQSKALILGRTEEKAVDTVKQHLPGHDRTAGMEREFRMKPAG